MDTVYFPPAAAGAGGVRRRALLGRLAGGLAAAGALALAAPQRAAAEPFRSFWVQTHRPTPLWSGPDAGATSFGLVRQWAYLEVISPQAGARLQVRGRDGAYGYVDAAAVGTVDPPTADAVGPTTQLWVANHLATTLWAGPDAEALPLGELGQWTPFEVLASAGARLRVRDPRTEGEAFLDAAAFGRIDGPERPFPTPARWWGSVGADEANVRAAPRSAGEPLGALGQPTPLVARAWVAGQEVLPDQPVWAELTDGVFVYSALLRAAPIEQPPPPPSNAPASGRWIDANLTHQVAVAYEGTEARYLARFSSGRPGWETSTGTFPITRRVATEVMDSATLLGRDAARANYRVEGIKWTQYFTADGQAIHHNYWRDPALFGMPSSHGCLGMLEPDARFFWDFATIGTRLVIHA